jgi:hypothetical protein
VGDMSGLAGSFAHRSGKHWLGAASGMAAWGNRLPWQDKTEPW